MFPDRGPRPRHVQTLLISLMALVLVACGGDDRQADAAPPPPPPPEPEATAWELFIDRQIQDYLEAHPAWAVAQGRHEFDGRLPDWSERGIREEIQRLKRARAEARAFPAAELSETERFQREYFLWRMDHDLFWLDKVHWPFRNPQFYIGWLNDSLDPSPYITLAYAPAEERMRAFIRYLQAIPEAVKQIRGNLRMPMPRPWLQLGVDAFGGYAAYFRDEVPAIWARVEDPQLQRELAAANAAAVSAMQGLADWLDFGRNIADDRFALGPELFRQMLWDTERVDVSLEKLEAIGRADMARNLEALRQACAEFAPGQEIALCIERMADRKPEDSPVQAARRQLVELREFLLAENLVSIPGSEEVLVDVAPPYARSNFAYIAIPGPWEENQPSVYYISPPNPAWPEQVQADYIAGEADLLFTSVHEVWPGHFLNFMHANRAPWVFGRAFISYALGEGWAHYTEEMMVEAGLRDWDPETRVGQLSNALLRNARFLAAIGLHTQEWTIEDARRFFMEEAFQSEGTAIQQAARGTYDPAYLNYTLGKLLIRRLREDWSATRGGRGAWRAFHDAFLSHGGPPIPLLRRRLMGESELTALFPRQTIRFEEATADISARSNLAWACEDGRQVVSSFSREDSSLWLFLPDRALELSPARSASGARFEAGDVQFWSKGESALLDDELGSTRCRLDRQATLWEDAKLRGADFRAVGNEPGWYLELYRGRPSLLVSDYGQSRYTVELSESENAPRAKPDESRFLGRVDGQQVLIKLRPGPCQDTLADEEYETRVEVLLGERELSGCGRALH